MIVTVRFTIRMFLTWASAGGGAKRAFSPLEMGTKKQKFLENVKSSV